MVNGELFRGDCGLCEDTISAFMEKRHENPQETLSSRMLENFLP